MTEYQETFEKLYHGTTEKYADAIIKEGFKSSTSPGNWCGNGVYFYDIRSKAWWSAERTCREIQKRTGNRERSAVIRADTLPIDRSSVFDLRVYKDLEEFRNFYTEYAKDLESFTIDGIEDELEKTILLRAFMISFFADYFRKKIVVGIFRQRPQVQYEKAVEFAGQLDIVFGVETIYCIKDPSILTDLEIRRKED